MGKKRRLKWLRRWSRMAAAGEVPKDPDDHRGLVLDRRGLIMHPAGFTRADWDRFNAQRELEGRTLTLEQRIAKRYAEAQAALRGTIRP